MKENKLNSFFTWLLLGTGFLLPIFFIPYFINPLTNSKLFLFSFVALLTGLFFIISSLLKKNPTIVKTPFTLPLLGFTLLVIISSLINHQYPSKQFLGLGGAYLSFATIILLAPSLLKANLSRFFNLAVNVVAIILSVLSISQLFGLGLPLLINRLSILNLPNSLVFSLTGATFVAIQFLSVALISNVFDQKTWRNSLFSKVTTVLIAIALGINIWAIMPGGEASFQSLSVAGSATVARNSLALTKNALFGYGPDSYSTAYDALRPIWTNGLDSWQFTFDSAFNFPLALIVSVGIVGFLAYLLFIWKVVVSLKKSESESPFLKTFILAGLVWQFFAPVSIVMLGLLAIALALFIVNERHNYQTFSLGQFENQSKVKRSIFLGTHVLIILALALVSYINTKTFLAYNFLYRTSVATNKNEIVMAYDYHKRAKDLAPKLDFVRRSSSLINLQIAIALSNKTDATQADQEQVLQLINQAISEAKAATILDPNNYQNWLALAQIYLQLVGTTEQAQQEAFNALAKAATYNPTSPELRILLGQLFLNSQKNSEAITFFNQAVERKPDLFIAHYYLAKALLADNQLGEARNAFVTSLGLVEKDSEDYKVIEKDLADVTARINSTTEKAPEQKDASSNADSEATEETKSASTSSSLSNLLDKQETEAVIQEGALTSDQNLVGN